MIQNGEKYMIQSLWIYPEDVWVDGDPNKGFTEEMKSVLTFCGDDGLHPHNLKEIRLALAHCAISHGALGTADDEYASNYWDHLEEYGISSSRFA